MRIKNDIYNSNVVLNYIFKISCMGLGLISVRLVLSFLGTNLYGLWVTITSIVAWMGTGDLGIGNGLRNELSKAYASKNHLREKVLISTAVKELLKVSFMLLLIFIVIESIFFRFGILNKTLSVPMLITTTFFCINLVLGTAQSVAFSYQRSWLCSLTSCESEILTILSVLVLFHYKFDANLSLFSAVSGFCSIIPNIVLILLLHFNKSIDIKLSDIRLHLWDSSIKDSITKVGIEFFGLQLCGLVLYSTDNVIINKIISSEMVTKYSIISKVYNAGTSLFSILLIALWSAVTYYMAQNNTDWIKKKVKQLLGIWVIFSLGVVLVSAFFNPIVNIWIKDNSFFFEKELVIIFAVYCIMTACSAIFVNVINGLGRIRLQLIVAIIAAVLNIPLSIFLAKSCNMGITGIKLATLLCQALLSIIVSVQAICIIKKWSNCNNNILKENNNE